MPVLEAVRSSVGKKVIMAVTGLILFGFVIGHLLGNLTIFGGPDALNAYAKKIRDLGPFLWVLRSGLILAVILHIVSAVCLTLENKKARPNNYVVKKSQTTTYAARTMAVSGLIVLAFIVYHLLHFTFRVTHPAISNLSDVHGHHDVYSMVVLSFQNGWLSASYIIAMVLLCSHLNHGFWSMFQSVGLLCEKNTTQIKIGSTLFALIIFMGYISIPLAVLVGRLTAGGAG